MKRLKKSMAMTTDTVTQSSVFGADSILSDCLTQTFHLWIPTVEKTKEIPTRRFAKSAV